MEDFPTFVNLLDRVELVVGFGPLEGLDVVPTVHFHAAVDRDCASGGLKKFDFAAVVDGGLR